MTASQLALTRPQILAFRRKVGALDERLPRGRRSLRRAAWAGLQDSMPRAALLSIHARVERTQPSTWEDSSLVQLWGPRHHAYVVAARDLALFSLGRLPDEVGARRVAEDLAARLHSLLAGAGIGPQRGVAAFDGLRKWLTPVRTPVGDSWILTSDEPTLRAAPGPAASARLLPSGDAYFLLQGRDRELLVPDPSRRNALWTP